MNSPVCGSRGATSVIKGITGVTRRGVALVAPPDSRPGAELCYGFACPLQVGPTTAALFCNIRPAATPGLDFEGGGDIVLFDDTERVPTEAAIPFSRNRAAINPLTGEPCIMIGAWPIGGFVPLGAKRPDGSPHPHAGTGFGFATQLSFPILGRHTRESLYAQGTKRCEINELYQFRYDGRVFSISGVEQFPNDGLLRGFMFANIGLSNAIPDGDDLLCPISGWRTGRRQGCGLLRMRRDASAWRPVAYLPVLGSDGPFENESFVDSEPTCLRDADGALLFTCRHFGWTTETRKQCHDVFVWRSRDGGATWERIISAEGIRGESPVTIGRTVDGTPYIVGNLNTGRLIMKAGWAGLEAGTSREILCLWPLNAERTGLEPAFIARDSRSDFGPPPNGTSWRVDHPVGVPLRLKDERWHNVLAYRVMEDAEYFLSSAPTPHTGTFIEKVLCGGAAIQSPWNF